MLKKKSTITHEETEELKKMLEKLKRPIDNVMKAKKEGNLLKNSFSLMKDVYKLKNSFGKLKEKYPGLDNVRNLLNKDPNVKKA